MIAIHIVVGHVICYCKWLFSLCISTLY